MANQWDERNSSRPFLNFCFLWTFNFHAIFYVTVVISSVFLWNFAREIARTADQNWHPCASPTFERCIQSAISKLKITLAALPIRIPMEYHLWKTEYVIHFILDLMKYLANVILIIRILAKQQLWIWPRNLLRLLLFIHITWQSIHYVTCWWIDIDRQLWIMDQTFEWSCSLFKATYNVEESNLKFLRRILYESNS